jgi:hypothetical protein
MAFKTTSASFAHTKNLYDNLSEVQQDFNERRLDRIVKNASEGKEKIKKLVAIRYAKEIEDEFKKLDVKLWGKAETQESVFGIITARHGDELTSEEPDSTVTKRLPSETSNAPGSKGVSGLSESDLQKAANLGGYDLDTPQGRKEAAEHAKRIKERDKNKKEFDNQ